MKNAMLMLGSTGVDYAVSMTKVPKLGEQNSEEQWIAQLLDSAVMNDSSLSTC